MVVTRTDRKHELPTLPTQRFH